MEKEFIEDIVASVKSDFSDWRELKRSYESLWQLNANFVAGNQYCTINHSGQVEDAPKNYYWQEREVFNHIAAIVETRLAKLKRVRPKMSIRPSSGSDSDIMTAKVSSKILESCYSDLNLDEVISRATMWSELTGTAFYKVGWNGQGGKCVGDVDEQNSKNKVFEGDVLVEVCSPYEIYPDSVNVETMDELHGIIHARAVFLDDIYRIWGKTVAAESSETLFPGLKESGSFDSNFGMSTVERKENKNSCLVIERYLRPSKENPNGQVAIVAGNQLLYCGELPFLNGSFNKRDFPFIKQCAITRAGCFFGCSMIERAIPIQRAYNAVKNRKHEFLNRISMGVLAVEDGSVDLQNLEDDGLSPGKILVYRQGSNPPSLLDAGNVPSDFSYEEDRLLAEFISISGVSELMRSSRAPTNVTSGTALQLLIEQDDTRLAVTAENIRNSTKRVFQNIIRLYKQFAVTPRLSRIAGEEGGVELLSWSASDISCDDVIFDTENELSNTPATRQSMMFELLRAGLLSDEDGKLSDATRYKLLDSLGYGGWEFSRDQSAMHHNKAAKEDKTATFDLLEVDDHNLHIAEHTRYLLSNEFEKKKKKSPNFKEDILKHIRQHKLLLEEKTKANEPTMA